MTDGNSKSEIAKQEEEILSFWKENNIFEKSLEMTKNKKPFVFYDGPPFATGTPHYGHLIASAMKDAIPRYQTMKGRFVERQWGWDTHGLPIEQIVEKELGIKSKKEIEEMGVEKFNNLCKEKIFTYINVWNEFIPRFGRWADMNNPYRTLDPTYMESEWWAFKELFDKGLIYKDYRSMHICPRCETTLAQAEVAEGYQTIKDISVTAKFELVDEPGTYVLAWTTTPWTLPGNVALAVGEDIDYVQNEDNLIFAKELLEKQKGASHNIKKEFKGKDLIGKEYKPLFDSYSGNNSLENIENGWKIYGADFVSTEEGTGVVHIAPAFGEDDMELGKKHNLPFVQHVGMDGVIKSEVKELAGFSVKPIDNPQATDIEILKILSNKELIFSKEKYEHSYPHCWRCDTPLLNYATSSWFVSVQKIKDDLLHLAKDINWSPKHIKEGRWLDWLENARDWSISRQRYWANTIPVWENEESNERIVIGSVEEIKKYSKKSGNKYFVMRHGEAMSNREGFLDSGGNPDNHLTKEGKVGVIESAKKLKKEGIDLIISSDVLRAKETAEIVAKETGVSEVIFDKRIKEKNFGEFNGKQIDEYSKYFGNIHERFGKACPGGESRNDIRKRMGEFIYETDSKYQDKTILIVSHGTPSHLLTGVSMGANTDYLTKNFNHLNNSEFREMEFSNLPHNDLYELDLHRPFVDEIELYDNEGRVYKRTTDVLDTWFDSGSVPFSSYHYPFENKDKVKDRIPADFIAEGLDQVSKWFYYQHVLSGGLFGKNAFLNVIVNGIVLAEDGKKMSKRLQNYPDPFGVVNKYGADAMRFYMLSSPVVQAENLNFSEKGVDEVYKKIILRLENVLSFLELYDGGEEPEIVNENILDKWIVARLNELNKKVSEGMENYELDKASRPFDDFIDDLSTWYIRRSRDRFKGEDVEDKENAVKTTKYVLLELSKLMAPFTPFIADRIFKKISRNESVHLESWPEVERIDEDLLEDMNKIREVVSLGLEARAKKGIKVRQPLASLKLSKSNSQFTKDDDLIGLIKDEVNVKSVVFDKNISSGVELDTNITPDLQEEGNARDLIRQIQSMRKESNLKPSDNITLSLFSNDDISFLDKYESEIKKVCGISEIKKEKNNGEEIMIGDVKISLKIK